MAEPSVTLLGLECDELGFDREASAVCFFRTGQQLLF